MIPIKVLSFAKTNKIIVHTPHRRKALFHPKVASGRNSTNVPQEEIERIVEKVLEEWEKKEAVVSV